VRLQCVHSLIEDLIEFFTISVAFPNCGAFGVQSTNRNCN